MKFTINRKSLTQVLFISFFVFVTMGVFLSFRPLYIIAILTAITGMSLGDNSYRIAFSLSLVPLVRIFDGFQITFLVNLMIAFPVFAYIIETRRINFTALFHVLMLSAWDLIHQIAFNTPGHIIPNLGSIIILYYVESVLTKKGLYLDNGDIARKFTFGIIFSSVLEYWVLNLNGANAWAYIQAWRLSGFAGDPNYFSLYISLAVIMLFSLRQAHKVRDYFYIFILIFLQLLTASKMALAVLVLTLLFFAAKAVYGSFSKKNRFARRILLALIAIAAIFHQYIVGLIDNILIRLQEHNGTNVDIDTITSNRFKILTFYSNELITNPMILLFGYGLQYNETERYRQFNFIAHNTYYDLILSWGVVGVVMFIVIFYQMLYGMRKNRTEKLKFDNFLPIIIVLVNFMALSCLSASMFWWVICAALLPLKGFQSNESTVNIRYRAGVQRRKLHINVRRVAS